MDDSVYYELAALERTHWWFQGRRRIVAAVLRHELGSPARPRRIVDVGCGTGEMLEMLAEFGEVSGLDASPIAVGFCRERFRSGVAVRLGRVPADVPSGADLITAFDVLEHLDDDASALAGIHGQLPPGGMFVCTVPAFPFLWSAHDVVHHHHRRYTKAVLRRRLEDAGFQVTRLTYFNTLLFPAAAAVRTAHRLLRRERSSDAARLPRVGNQGLLRLFTAEARLVVRTGLPVGVSLLAVCHRPLADQPATPAAA